MYIELSYNRKVKSYSKIVDKCISEYIILHSIEQIILMDKRRLLPKVPETYRKA